MNGAGENTTPTTFNQHELQQNTVNPNPNPNNLSQQYHLISPQPQTSRRPRGFAVTGGNSSGIGDGKGRREREKEKERTKLRERHRRAITSRMLSGLRQYGNFPLPARADMNDVIAALAREAGWLVEPDGTTYRASPPPIQLGGLPVRSSESPLSATSPKNCSMKAPLDCQPPVFGVDETLSPASFDSAVVTEMETKSEKFTSTSNIDSPESLEAHQLIQDVQSDLHENDFTGTRVPVYIKLSSGIINSYCQLVDPEGIRQELKHLKALNVEGVVVDCWWGIVEGWNPQKYIWSGYRELFTIIRELQLKMQVVLAFHEYGGSESGNVFISLPHWILEIGKDNQDIFFTDREGRRNTECISWGIDKERVLRGRTGIEVYFDFMRSFRSEFDDIFGGGYITAVEIGLGASGELKFPAFPERLGWRYPGIGEFQCYDRYLQQNLRKAAKLRGHSFWARGPDNAGHYNSRPPETGFFCERGDYDSYFGRFFLHWYTQILIDHADNVLSLASLAFEGTQIVVKIPAVYWWYKTPSHAAELTAGYYNPTNRDGYSPVFKVLRKHSVTMKFVCPTSHFRCPENDESFAYPEGLSWQVLNVAWDCGLSVAGQNADPCFDRGEHIRMVETSKPRNDPDQRHFSFFVYQLPSPFVQRTYCFTELNYFIKSMHGENGCHQEAA
ncbi:beta-amylase 8 isoform X1 [Beta vulgaris subsp. vulgaris]|uniref:beta-amylase 8 isoform X1 n=2 Tax=Beta vulgaris subsp. vulgaris TaxID=3555 RepID=UPI0020369519|nr:beta-amylase 8 isoform X1 [Beta vulgaris subsp. vulgaris]